MFRIGRRVAIPTLGAEESVRFHRDDWLIGGVSGLAALAAYGWTVAPTVTFQDSGDLIIAAQHLGVPHPSGYPLWAILAWCFTALPIGNVALEVNLFSSFSAAAAVGVLSMVMAAGARWIGSHRLTSGLLGFGLSMAAAFSLPVWSQAVIAEVYSLHLLLVMLLLAVLLGWFRRWLSPARGLVLSHLVIALGLSNHHLFLVLIPLPWLALLLLERHLFWECLAYGCVLASGLYLGFAWLGGNPLSLQTAGRAHLAAWLWILARGLSKRGFPNRKVGLAMAGAVALGLAPHLYLPLASAGNPPLNWGYSQERAGFFYLVNRTQYGGDLERQLLGTVGRIVGTVPFLTDEPTTAARESRLMLIGLFAAQYWRQLLANFTPAVLILLLGAVWGVFRLPARQAAWISLLSAAFLLSAFLQPSVLETPADLREWRGQTSFQGASYFLFTLLCGIGAAVVLEWIARHRVRMALTAGLSMGIGCMVLTLNWVQCSRRGHGFAWEFGHRILNDLPRDSILVAGSGGLFVTTYMVSGESLQETRFKRDPAFDRRDVYLVSQDLIGIDYYLRSLRNRYSGPVSGRIDLESDPRYPAKALRLPTRTDLAITYLELAQSTPGPRPDSELFASTLIRQIFLENRGQHPFFLEEGFPMGWSYDHAVPHGLIFRLSPEPLAMIPRGEIDRDRSYWRVLATDLFSDSRFQFDGDARRAYARRRFSFARLYQYRKLTEEAEAAYREAIEFWPEEPEIILGYADLLTGLNRSVEASALLSAAVERDPYNKLLRQWFERVREDITPR